MFFLIAMLIIGVSCIAITYKTLVGYGTFPLWLKALLLLLLIAAWFSPVIVRFLRHLPQVPASFYAVASNTAYFLMGFGFILIMLLLVRDFLWYIVYYLTHNQAINPTNIELLNRMNFWTLILAFGLSLYAVYEAHKIPTIKEIDITDNRIKGSTRIVVASDLHIDQATPMVQINMFVDTINSLKPDYVLLVGDVIDDVPEVLETEMNTLQKIKAKKVYVVLGNHEYYNAPIKWIIKFSQMGFDVLHNRGELYNDLGLYIAGVPDFQSGGIDYERALQGASEDSYKILMSHSPVTAKDLEKGQFDLQVSGHTHGGQLFPFSLLAQKFNGFLAGMYQVNGNQLYITRGVGYWGPPMRLLAPSDITVFNLKGANNES